MSLVVPASRPDAGRPPTRRAPAHRRRVRPAGQRRRVDAPDVVTLSSEQRPASGDIVNGLDQPVTVRHRGASPTAALELEDREPGRASAPGSRTPCCSTRDRSRLGVHQVTLVVTDAEGDAAGASDDLHVRAAQVSGLIWVIIAGGVGAALRRDRRPARPPRPRPPAPRPPSRAGRVSRADDTPRSSASSAVMAAGTVVSRLSGFVRSAAARRGARAVRCTPTCSTSPTPCRTCSTSCWPAASSTPCWCRSWCGR